MSEAVEELSLLCRLSSQLPPSLSLSYLEVAGLEDEKLAVVLEDEEVVVGREVEEVAELEVKLLKC